MLITLEFFPGTNQYKVMRVKFLAEENKGSLSWGWNSQPTNYKADCFMQQQLYMSFTSTSYQHLAVLMNFMRYLVVLHPYKTSYGRISCVQ